MMNPFCEHALLLGGILFSLGLVGLLMRRNVLFMLMSVEIMMNAAGLGFIAAGARWGQADGQIMFLFIIALAAAEVSIALALILRLYSDAGTVDADAVRTLSG